MSSPESLDQTPPSPETPADPILEGIDPNAQVNDIYDLSHQIASKHKGAADLIHEDEMDGHMAADEKEEQRRKLSSLLIRNTLNSDQAQIVAEAGKPHFEEEAALRRSYGRKSNVVWRKVTGRKLKNDNLHWDAADRESEGLREGMATLANAQIAAHQKRQS